MSSQSKISKHVKKQTTRIESADPELGHTPI